LSAASFAAPTKAMTVRREAAACEISVTCGVNVNSVSLRRQSFFRFQNGERGQFAGPVSIL
jgi:hypothetical protein